jgi:GNAT superfamily N-acetyltransferase
MEGSEIGRIAEIDRSERITRLYTQKGDSLDSREVDIRVPPWSSAGDNPHSVRRKINSWQAIVDGGGVPFGAFDHEALVGFAVFQPDLAPGMANFAVLHVSRSHRRQGVGARLAQEVIRLARLHGATELYVSATPSAPTVKFYGTLGFEPTAEPHADLLREEPDDIHMILKL